MLPLAPPTGALTGWTAGQGSEAAGAAVPEARSRASVKAHLKAPEPFGLQDFQKTKGVTLQNLFEREAAL